MATRTRAHALVGRQKRGEPRERALVTGASGFTGRALCALLAEEGIEVFAASRTGPSAGRSLALEFPLPTQSLIELVGSIQPDYVFHLAGILQAADPAAYYQVNVEFAAALLEAVRRLGRPCVVLMVGSAAEYGMIKQSDLPIREALPPRPRDHYGISKLAQTHLALASNSSDFRVVVARTFNLVGPGMPRCLAIQAFIDQLVALEAQRDKVLRVGNLAASRDYLHVRTAAKAYWRLARAEKAFGRVVNVCSGSPVTMQDIVNRLVDIAEREVRIEVDPARLKRNDVPAHYGDNRLLRQLTGMVPALDMDAALREAFEHSKRAARDNQ